MSTFISELNTTMNPEPNESVFGCIWKEYESVIVRSLITSFGLDFLIKDQDGGDVDTILNVRKIQKEGNLQYKNEQNKKDYENRGDYDRVAYHQASGYREIVQNAKKEFNENGIWIDDAYVNGNKVAPVSNKTLDRNRQGQLDHVMSAKEIHDDPGRVLAGLDGCELANNPENLRYTNAALNNNMRDKTAEEYIKWCEENPDKVNWGGKKGEPLPEDVKKKLLSEYNRSKKMYEAKIAKTYYTSSKFAKDTAKAAGKRGIEMGIRQALGFVFAEIWFASKEELQAVSAYQDLSHMMEAVGKGIRKGLENAKHKYKDLLVKIEEGFTAGILSSITTTLCNIFFTTAKNLVRIIRQVYASVIEAGKVLLFNPDELMFGDRIKKAAIILGTGASVVVGTAVGEMISKTGIGAIPGVSVFCSTLVSGLLSCTLLIFLDRSKFINQVITELNGVSGVSNYRQIADAMERLAVKVANLDIDRFAMETRKYSEIAVKIASAGTEDELNGYLLAAYKEFQIQIPWKGDFDSFMSNKDNKLVFG